MTEDEFLKPENKFLLVEWEKKKKEEEEKNKVPIQKERKRINKIEEMKVDEKGVASWLCVYMDKKMEVKEWLEDARVPVRMKKDFAEKNGYERVQSKEDKKVWIWIKSTPKNGSKFSKN